MRVLDEGVLCMGIFDKILIGVVIGWFVGYVQMFKSGLHDVSVDRYYASTYPVMAFLVLANEI